MLGDPAAGSPLRQSWLQRYLRLDGVLLSALLLLTGVGLGILYSAFDGHLLDLQAPPARVHRLLGAEAEHLQRLGEDQPV